MDSIVRATCPTCGAGLRIPAQWVGQAVRCKKCGSVVRSKPKSGGTDVPVSDTTPAPIGHYNQGQQPAHAPGENAFDFSKPPLDDDPFPLPEPMNPAGGIDGPDPFGQDEQPAQPQPAPPMPGYPYPVPPGYPPGAYAPPAGYPYPVPPGYPYPVPPGYGPQGAYPVPPGYQYPLPPGYGPPGGYPVPPGYPYPVPPGAIPPEAANSAAQPAAAPPAQNPQPLFPNAPVKPAIVKPQVPAAAPVMPASPQQSSTGVPQYTPDPVPPSSEFKTDASIAPAKSRRYQRSGKGPGKLLWIAICVVMSVGLAAGGIAYFSNVKDKADHSKKLSTDPTKLVEMLGSDDPALRESAMKALKEQGSKAETALKVGSRSENPEIAKRANELLAALNVASSTGGPAKVGAFPRRLLFIHISKYMFLNPLTGTEENGRDRTREYASRLAYGWRVPRDKDDQMFFLSDTAAPMRGVEVQVPMKNVVTGAYERFFETSRAQDRIVIYFGGHAVEKEGKAYIVPVEGDPDEVDSLIPLDDFYAKMKACKATQKIVIWDVCRFNPNRGKARVAGSETMTESLAKSLAEAPPGVEVVTTCQPGENALEFYALQDFNGGAKALNVGGSAFLESAKYSIEQSSKNATKAPALTDPIPIAELVPALSKRLNDLAGGSPGEQHKQTAKVDGRAPASLVAYNPEEAPAKKFDMPLAPKSNYLGDIESIENEFNVPPMRRDTHETALKDLVYKDEVMKDFKSDVTVAEIKADKEKYKFQARTLEAFDAIREMYKRDGPNGGPELIEYIDAPITDMTKNKIFKDLEFYAIGIARLEIFASELDAVAGLKESQSKRWQAHYEYARALLKSRLAYMHEYDKVMGDVRTGTLPALDKDKKQNQYRLLSSDKMKSKKDVQKLAEEAQESYNTLITQYKGTPWAIQAKREKSFSLGLYWSPATSADKDAPPTQ